MQKMLKSILKNHSLFMKETRAAIAVGFVLLSIPLLFAIGMAIDYARAKNAETRLNAAADSAALYTVSRKMMDENLTIEERQAAAVEIFNRQIKDFITESNLIVDSVTPHLEIDSNNKWDFTLSYVAESENDFQKLLGRKTITISGSSSTHNEIAPDIDFYFLLDTSMSMALPTTASGLELLKSRNSRQCAFACHSLSKNNNDWWTPLGKDKNGQPKDLYDVIRSFEDANLNNDSPFSAYKYPLRIDAERYAVERAAQVAQSVQAKNRAKYQFAVYQFNAKETWDDASMDAVMASWNQTFTLGYNDIDVLSRALGSPQAYPHDMTQDDLQKIKLAWKNNNGKTEMFALSPDLNAAAAMAKQIKVPEYSYDNCPFLWKNCEPFGDYHTASNNALKHMQEIIGKSGSGLGGDTPQKVLLIVTDGARDEAPDGGDYGARDANNKLTEPGFVQKYCQALKNNGVRIAILYTEYLLDVVDNDPWSQSSFVNYQPKIEPALRECSDNGQGGALFAKITTDQDILGAVESLFSNALATAVIKK